MKNLFIRLLTAGLFVTVNSFGKSVQWYKTIDGQVNCVKIEVQ